MGENHQNLRSPHIIIIPPPFQGHLNPSVQLTLNLASKGLLISFINTHAVHQQITEARNKEGRADEDEDLFSRARRSGLRIRNRTIGDGFPLSFDRSLHREQFLMGRIHVFPAHVDEVVGELMGSDPRPDCLVADTFSTWGHDVARRYGLVFVSLWTQPAALLSIFCHLDLLRDKGHYGSKDNCKDIIDYVPGVKPLEPKYLMSFLQQSNTSMAMNQLIQGAFSDVQKADFIICNTVDDLEPEPISALKEIRPTYAIGPLFASHFTNPAVVMNLWAESDCARWLDTKPHGSVLYASFGSYAHTTKEEIKTIANGIMLSEVNFIWVLRPDIVSSDVTNVLPDGFFGKVGNRGLIVPWCKQHAVLSHSAVGGFLSHCGWNSILESMWVGVPLMCYPLAGDQTTNRKLVVDDWGIGINLFDEENEVSSDEVAKKIELLMSGETSDELRKNIGRVKKKLEKAMSPNGSSQMNFDKFVEDVKAKIELHWPN